MFDVRPPQLSPAVLLALLAQRAGHPFHAPQNANQSWMLPVRGSAGPQSGTYRGGMDGPGLAANQQLKPPVGASFFGSGGYARPASGGHSYGTPSPIGPGGSGPSFGPSPSPPSYNGGGGVYTRPPTGSPLPGLPVGGGGPFYGPFGSPGGSFQLPFASTPFSSTPR